LPGALLLLFQEVNVIQKFRTTVLLIVLFGAGSILMQAQSTVIQTDCQPDTLASEQARLMDSLDGFSTLLDKTPQQALGSLYEVGFAFQELALRCGYRPDEEESEALTRQVLSLIGIEALIRATTVGVNVDDILLELETVVGNTLNGQLLYNSLEPAVDGAELGCSGCHTLETAPPTEGVWTRVVEIRLETPELADYDVRRYLVESIVQPNVYIVPEYTAVLMPGNFGHRLSLQNLADLVAYLESQDQLLD
jgi:hypothetical protein